MADELQNIVLQVKGELELKRLNAELAKEREHLEKLISIQKQGVVGVNPVDIDNATKRMRDFNKEIADVTKTMPTRSAFNSQGLQQLGYALQDFTSASGGFPQKLNSITNNLQMVAQSLGVGGGWFIGITAAVQALQLFANNWDKIDAWLRDLPSPEELKAKADAQKKRQEELAGITGAHTAAEKGAAEGAGAAFGVLGGAKVQQNLEQVLANTGAGWSNEQKRKWGIANIAKYGNAADYDTAMNAAESADRAKGAKEEVARLMTQAVKPGAEGAAARERIKQIIQANPGRFPQGALAALEAANFPSDQAEGMEMDWNGLKPPEFMTGTRVLGGGAPVVPDDTAEAKAEMHANRETRQRALGEGRAGPLISDAAPGRRRRKGRHNYQQTGVYDPDVMQAHQQVNGMLDAATVQTDQQSAQMLRPGMMELHQKLQALQRRMSSQLAGPPTGGFTQLPEAW
jgi:hypothetical protein